MSRKTTSRERPSIELYMYSVNQEFPRQKGHSTFLKRHSEIKPDVARGLVGIEEVESQVFGGRTVKLPADWSVQWLENRWVENHTKAVGLEREDLADPLQNAILREEDFGGILFEPQTDRVFKLNAAGVALWKELREYARTPGKDLREFTSDGSATENVRNFVAYLEGAALWRK